MKAIQEIANIKQVTTSFFCVLCSLTGIAQNVEAVDAISLSAYQGKSYYYKTSVTLQPGFSVSAQANSDFFCRYENYVNQPLSSDKNFIRIEHALAPTTSEGQFSNFTVDQKQTNYRYYDEAGRGSQSVILKGSPLKNDVIAFQVYETDGWQTKTYMPYASTTSSLGAFTNAPIADQATFYNGASKVAADTRPFSEQTLIEKSPLGRVKEAYGPGSAWFSTLHKSSTSFTVNSAITLIKRWQINATTGLPYSSSNYPDSTIFISLSADEDGNATSSMKDFRGNVVQTLIQSSPQLITHYVYDDFGRLRFVIPPAASDNVAPDQAHIDRWAFQYQYDSRGRLVKQKGPGTDWTYTIYDGWDRPVLTQDGAQRAKTNKEWTFVKYDAMNRVIMTGILQNNNTFDQMVLAVTGGHHEDVNTSSIGYTTGNSYPSSITESNLLTIAYYDNYSFLSNAGWDAQGNNFAFISDPLFTTPQFTAVKGLTTGSKIKLIGTTTWLNAVTYYDKKYSAIQSVQEHHLGGTDRIFAEYNFPGWLMKSKRVHNSSVGSATIFEEFVYDHAGRLTKHYHTIDSGPRVLLTDNKYNELGQVVEVNTHSTDYVNFLQSADYRYNIRGSLTHINNSSLSNDLGVTNDDTNDLFGMQIVYHDETQLVNGVNTVPKYNGNITAIKWKTDNKKDVPKERIYGHHYTPSLNQLNKSLFAAKSGSTWTGEPGHYDLTNVTYDKNGNIQTLNRFAEASDTRVALDQLTYGYATNGNKLTNVEDSADPAFGFKNGTVGIPTEYNYDPNGNLTSDLNKGVIGVTYNYLNLPDLIEFYDGTRLEYTYDASGYVVKKVLRKSGTIVSQVDYVSGIQYFNNALTLIFTSEGRATKYNSTYEYEYFLKDHLTNTRVVYGYLHDTDVYKATMEMAYDDKEQSVYGFKNITTTRFQDPAYNHTKKNLDVPVPDRSAETNGFLNKAIGPAKLIAVTAGDKVKMEVYARYITSTAGSTTIINNLVAAVTSSFGIVNSGETQTAFQALSNNLPGTSALITGTANVPKAYLYYIIFNSSYVFQQFGYFSVPQAALLGQVPLNLTVTIPTNGFLYTYVANESSISSATSVFFDDFTIVHEKTTASLRVTESTDYDPFGVVLEGTHYVDESRPLNTYLYQGEFSEYESQSGWHRFSGRGNYDALLGRWNSADPANQFASPYTGMGNNPVAGVDPDGNFFWAALPFAAKTAIGLGAIFGAYSGYQIGKANGASGFWEWAGYVGGNAIVGGIAGYAGYSVSILNIPFANTASIVAASTINSGGSHLLSGGGTDFTTSFGGFSVNWSTGNVGYLGNSKNSELENFGYAIGAFANASDIYGFAKGAFGSNADDLDLVTKNDPIGHAELRKGGKNVISVGPDQGSYVPGDSFWDGPGTNNWPTHAYDKDLTVSKIKLTNVRMDKINQYVRDELGGFRYKALKFNCVTACSNALLRAGVLNIPFLRHPSLLQLQMFFRQNAYYTSFINYR